MSVCITLREMGKRDDSTPRRTRELDSARLAALTKQSRDDNTLVPAADAVAPQEDAPAIAVGRAPTVDDPLTTGLLAEVARRSQTTEFDEHALQEVLATVEAGDADNAAHPHTRRRNEK
jgi:hypothetical protein